ncbi:MAG: hypothetical protein LBD37_11035 [Treponema sp.]|jgi:hypothetical protein|nr:hypothetical protein [Treponema sp.]
MANDYRAMSAAELEELLRKTRGNLENMEDERHLILEQSQSGQHTGSKPIQSRIKTLDNECAALKNAAEEISEALSLRR